MMSHGVHETGIIERIYIEILAELRGHNIHGRYKKLNAILKLKFRLIYLKSISNFHKRAEDGIDSALEDIVNAANQSKNVN